jgi:hypothetical protein
MKASTGGDGVGLTMQIGFVIFCLCKLLYTMATPETSVAWLDCDFRDEHGTFAKHLRRGYPRGELFGPTGLDHNGSARMYNEDTFLRPDGVRGIGKLCIGARRLSPAEAADEDPTYDHGHLAVLFRSGAVHTRNTITVNKSRPKWIITAWLACSPTTAGVWPAFWLSGIDYWPPEFDIWELNGNNGIQPNSVLVWQNTMQGQRHDDPRRRDDVIKTEVPHPGKPHEVSVMLELEPNGTDVRATYSIDGGFTGKHVAFGHADKAMHLILNLQMQPDAEETTEDDAIWLECHGLTITCQRCPEHDGTGEQDERQ